MDIRIIHEDNHIIVAEKPPKVPSQSDKTGDKDMLSMLKEYLKKEYPAARNPYIGLIHRLDRPVGGVMVFAKTKDANAKLSEQIRTKQFEKQYYAVACGKSEADEKELRNHLLKLRAGNISKVVHPETKGAKEALLEYQVLDTIETDDDGPLSLLRVKLKTGRHHQIRVQLANANLPLWGDNKYNETFVKMKGWTQIALWAGSLAFFHPKDKKKYCFKSNPKEQYPFTLFGELDND